MCARFVQIKSQMFGVANGIDRTTFLEHTTVAVPVLGTMAILCFLTQPLGVLRYDTYESCTQPCVALL